MSKPFIYMDNAATTKVAPQVLDAMMPYFSEIYANGSSVYQFGQTAKEAIENARAQAAALIGAKPEEIYFTGGGSESDNWAIKNAAEVYGNKGKHIITSNIEHHAVLHTCQYLEKHGFEVTYLPVDSEGRITPEQLEAAIRPDTILVSIMTANNEIGTIEPIKELGRVAHEHGVLFHTDAVQAAGHLAIDVQKQNIDLLSLSAHKFHGPKGVGVLYARKGVPLTTLIEGGAQERGKRAGTENIPAIVGMAAALEEACRNMEANRVRMTALRDQLIQGLEQIPHSVLNGDAQRRLPGNVHFCFEGIEGEALLLLLDDKGICASSGSACTSGSLDPSHVLLAIGRPHDIAHGSLRLTLSEATTEEEVRYAIDAVTQVVAQLRGMSPVWRDLENGVRQFVI